MPKTYGKVYTATDMLKRRRRAFAVTTMFGAVPLTGIRRMCPGSIVIQVGTGGMEPTAYSCTERELFFADERDALISALDAGWCGKWRASASTIESPSRADIASYRTRLRRRVGRLLSALGYTGSPCAEARRWVGDIRPGV